MPNINYGTGGSSLNAAQGFDAVSALMNGFFGSPQLRFEQQKFGLQQDQAAQNAMQFNARQDLGNIVREGIINKDPKGRVMISREAAGRAAQAGDLPQYGGLIRAMNEPVSQDIDNENKLKMSLLTASPLARDFYFADQTHEDPEQRRRFLDIRNFATSQQAIDDSAALQRKLDYERGLFQTPNMNSGVPQAVLAVMRSGNPQEQINAELAALERFGRSMGSSGGFSPEQKAAGENQRDVLGLTTPVSPAEGNVTQRLSDIKTNASLAEIMAKASTADINTSQGRLARLSAQDNLTARQQIDEETNQKIREEEAKAQFASKYGNISTEAGYKAQMAREAGIPALEQYATEVKPLVVPEGGSAVIPKGSYLERNFKPSADAVAASKQAQETLMSMTKEEIAGLPKDQLVKLKQTIDAGKNTFPTPMQPENISGRFPTKAEAPKAGQLTYDGSIVSSSKLDKVDPRYDIEFDKLLDAYDGVNRALEAVKKNPRAFGAQYGMASGMPYFGNMAKNQLLAEGETKARAAVFDATATKKHEIYGAALTGGEQIDANNFLPASSDSPEEIKEKLKNLQAQLYTVIERRMDTFHPFNGYHFLKSYESGRKMIDPASMTRAQEKNGARIPQRKD